MTDEPEASVLGSLPRSRPQRRSDKRGARAERPAAERPEPTAEPPESAPERGERPAARPSAPEPDPEPEPAVRRPGCAVSLDDGAELAGTVVRATAELAEVGITLAARALRNALSRLPRP